MSVHLVCASTTTKNIFPWNGPAKSICSRCHGYAGYSHLCSGACFGLFATPWHPSHLFVTSSMSSSIRGHQTCPLASPFIFTIPMCPSCSVSITLPRSFVGTITLLPHIRIPWCGVTEQSMTTILRQLHWLLVRKRIDFKLLVLVHRAIYNGTPEFLAALLRRHTPPRSLRSAGGLLLEVPIVNLERFGRRAFACAGTTLWNKLPRNIRDNSNITQFKKQLKTFLFST